MYTPDSQIIIEGPDLSGKSTISLVAQVVTGLSTYHAGGPPTSDVEALARVYGYPKDVILDRHLCISESVYGHIMRPQTILRIEWMMDHLRKQDYIVLYCRLPLFYLVDQLHYLHKTKKAYKSKEHIDQVMDKYESIYNRYDEVMSGIARKRICRVIPVDFTTTTSTQMRDAIKRADNEYKRCK